ncbi:hypothetical protein WP12_20185 [Sphingomonas sp. SRS2]|nr:hypothetical protein WP12_20185 [Sphingomonas sp. SRS2]
MVESYIRLVDWIAVETGFEDKLLHVHAGLLIFLLAKLATRRSLSSPIPLACVCAGELINEIFDRMHHGRWMPDTASDVVNTLFWPAMIFVLLRLQPGKASGRSGRR